MSKSWCVVEFTDGVQIVPNIWIEGDKSYWPTFNGTNAQNMYKKAVVEYHSPDESWPLFPIRILGIYDSYYSAVPKLKIAELQSDLSNESDFDETLKKSRSVRKKIIRSDSDEEETESDAGVLGIKPFPAAPKKTFLKSFTEQSCATKFQAENDEALKNIRQEVFLQSNPPRVESFSTPKNRTVNTSSLLSACENQPNPTGAESFSTPKNRTFNTTLSLSSACESDLNDMRPDFLFASNGRQPITTSSRSVIGTKRSDESSTTVCTCCCQYYREFQKNELKDIKNQVSLVIQMLREWNINNTPLGEAASNNDDFDQRLPLKSQADVEEMENLLRSEDEQNKMILYLAKIGGHEVNTIVKNIMKTSLTNGVAALYNWEGKKNKKMFSSLLLSDCITKAVIRSPNISARCTKQDIINAVKNWLRHASARLINDEKKRTKIDMGNDD